MKQMWWLAVLGGVLLLVFASPGARGDDAKRAEQVKVLREGIERLTEQLGRLDRRVRTLEGGGAPPPAPKPPLVASKPGAGAGVTEKYDRFTGETRVTATSGWLKGRHKDTGETLELAVQYVVERSEGQPAEHVLYLAARPDRHGWERSVRVYMLLDGARHTATARTSSASMPDGTAVQQAYFSMTGSIHAAVTGAKTVELRIGDIEIALPAALMASMRTADAQCASRFK